MKIGLALGGGGAKGFAHIGALRVLTEAGIKADVVAGTSVGALVGAVYAAGALNHFEREAKDIKLSDIPGLLSPAWSLSGFFDGENALEILSALVEIKNIEDLPIPFAAVSADLNTSKAIHICKGDLRQAIRASISIPAVFTPVQEENMLLVDGGTLEPVPVSLARSLGADFVIAIDLFGPEKPGSSVDYTPFERTKLLPEKVQSALTYLQSLASKLPWAERFLADSSNRAIPSIVDIVERTLALSQRTLTEYRLTQFPPDFLLQPAVSDIGLLDFHKGEPTILRGVEATQAALPLIQDKLQKFEMNARI